MVTLFNEAMRAGLINVANHIMDGSGGLVTDGSVLFLAEPIRAKYAGPARGAATSIEELTGSEPEVFALRQNYPNPFNPTTAIHFDLPEASQVTLVIYDIIGREVTRLVDHQRYDAGRHQVQWDAARFASGIYFYRIETNKHAVIKKMMLIK